MKKSQFSEEQIVRILQDAGSGQKSQSHLCREHGISENIFYTWKRKFNGLQSQDVRRLKVLEQENSQLKRLLAEETGRSMRCGAWCEKTAGRFRAGLGSAVSEGTHRVRSIPQSLVDERGTPEYLRCDNGPEFIAGHLLLERLKAEIACAEAGFGNCGGAETRALMRILIAEDNNTTRLLLSATLRKLGHEVVATENGREAWEAWRGGDFALLISD